MSRTKKNLEITILEKDDFIKSLQIKLKAKEDPVLENDLNNLPATQSEELNPEERYEEGEEDVEITEANPWHVKQGTTFKCPICSFTRKTESQIRNHMKVHDDTAPTNQIQERTTKSSSQIHCALKESSECNFQCSSKEKLEKHIQSVHRSKSTLQCTVCPLLFRNIDDLSRHMNMAHKAIEDTVFKWTQCDNYFQAKSELNKHIIDYHRSYRPCKAFATNSCEYEECRFYHVILKDNERICYKCAQKVKSQMDLRRHMNDKHGDIFCKKFLDNKCSFGARCMFSHTIPNVQNNQVFQKSPNPPLHSPEVPNMSVHIQNQQRSQKPQEQISLPMNIMNMIPQIVTQVVKLLTLQLGNKGS